MTNRKRVAALLLCIGLVFALAVSSACIAHEAGHDCTGEDCPICRIIATNEDVLRMSGLAVLMLLALFALPDGSFACQEQQLLCRPVSGTLVSWKIRLND